MFFTAIRWSLLLFFVVGCDAATNINQIFVSKNQKNTLRSLLDQAQLEYDKGNFSDALELAEKARDISPDNEDVSVLLGYIHLSLSGMDPFILAKALITAGKSSTSKTTLQLASTNNAASFLAKIRAVLDVKAEDLAQLGELQDEEELARFKDYPVVYPSSAAQARESDLNAFKHINLAIAYICPFVAEGVKLKDVDSRHDCEKSQTRITKSVMSHFLWAFVHIAEAAVFFGVLQYQNDDATEAHIQSRSDELQAAADSLSIGEYALHVTSLAEAVNSIFAVGDPASQFSAVLNDISAASLAFAEIGNVPAKVKRALEKATTSITSATDVAGDSEVLQQRNALKNQINEKIAGKVRSQISRLSEENPEEFEANKEDLCSAYNDISGGKGVPEECVNP